MQKKMFRKKEISVICPLVRDTLNHPSIQTYFVLSSSSDDIYSPMKRKKKKEKKHFYHSLTPTVVYRIATFHSPSGRDYLRRKMQADMLPLLQPWMRVL